ncbi:MAG TPA: Calx-beta domain-containing protein [Pyrinomonadaceae bacterium]|nr:Calx-beta domain-containing protein [Pyrinomonadaceae bacterium]
MKKLLHSYRRSSSARWIVSGFILCLLASAIVISSLLPRGAVAANPPSGAIGPTGPVPTFTGSWTGTATSTGANAHEADCTEGVNCDTFRLTVVPGDYTGKIIAAKLQWTAPANDYDIYIHKCPTLVSTNDQCNATPPIGQSTGGAPATEENSAIDPANTGPGDYTIRTVYSAVTPLVDQYHGSVALQAKTQAPTATYISGGLTFSPSVTARAPVAPRDGEPSNRTDKPGNFYIAGIRGFPAGVDLWYVDLQPSSGSYDPFMRNPIYRGQPDAFSPDDAADLGGDGGGDVDLAVSMPDPTNGNLPSPPTLASSSLIAANISSQKSTDKGATFTRNNLGNATGGVPADDRQWEEFYGPNTVYLLYRTLEPAVTQIQRSTDGGLTFGPAQTAGAIGQVGYIDVHQPTGTVYISGSTGQVCHSTVTLPTGEAAVYQCTQAATDANGVNHLFFPVKVADDGTPNGTVYVAYSNAHDIFLVHSTDKGVTWSTPVRVSNGAETKTSLFPWLETGPTPGSVGIVWYGSASSTNDDNANWEVFFAQSFNATSNNPTFRQTKVSDHIIHASNVSEGGLCVSPVMQCQNRNLIDYFQISFDPTGAAVIGYTDDHNDFDGHVYLSRQIGGPKISGDGKTNVPDPGPTPAPVTGPQPSAASVGGIAGSQVTDFAQDAASGRGLTRINANDPFDILSIKYECEVGPGGETVISATMKVSDLTVVPAGSDWRMNFTANAPFSGLSPVGDYSFAVSDRGDQFYLRASTETNPAGTFTYGTAVRASDGTITYTDRGSADCGSFDTTNKTITIKVSVSKLNSLVTHGPAIGPGSVLSGLRGSTFTASSDGRRDITRGGTEFVVGNCANVSSVSCALPSGSPTPTPTPTATPTPTPAPTSTFQFSSAAYPVQEDCTQVVVTVTRVGTNSTAATVDYTSVDGTAKQKGDYIYATGRLFFGAGETQKTFPVLVNEDSYTEGPETASIILSNPSAGTTLGVPASASVQIADDTTESSSNPIDDARNFVGQHYHDFLNRQSDQSGEDFWTAQITGCGSNAACLDEKRTNVSAAFFLSIEFQNTGYLVIRTHKAAFGSEKSNPRYTVFLRDQRAVSDGVVIGQPGADARLEQNKVNFFQEFVQRPEFLTRFPQGTPAANYVDGLFSNASVTPTTAERNAAISAYGSGDTAGRAAALRSVADSNSVYQFQYNPAFVLMEYYGYLRRNPDDIPDNSFSGYDFWLSKMNQFSQPGEDVRNDSVALSRVKRAEMVKAFIVSAEYRERFAGSPTGNQQGPSLDGTEISWQQRIFSDSLNGKLLKTLAALFVTG